MFRRLEDLGASSLFILTGVAGAGKSHLAASVRRSGSIWLLDTEGAAQSLLGKPEIHPDIRAVQTLSIPQLLAAMHEILRIGTPGDTVILDSISKLFQALRSYAMQRTGTASEQKTGLAADEHAAINRNLQVIYTGLTELKQAGFQVILIGHLARKYQATGTTLTDVGLRVLADEQLTYEADAILLVERTGLRRTLMPIIKPPRSGHLQLGRTYPATISTLFPHEAIVPTPTAEAPLVVELAPPKTLAEAEQRFYARYSQQLGGTTWAAVQRYLGYAVVKPTTIQRWIEVAAAVRAKTPNP